MATAKTAMKYRIVTGRNPKTGETLLRPVITERESYNLDQVVAYALNANYVRGQFHDMRGALNGFIEAMQQLGKEGKSVCLNNWLRIHGELTGTVGETRQLTDANELHVAITALTDLKGDIADFSWTNVSDDGVRVKISTVASAGLAAGLIQPLKKINVNGTNLVFNADWGDTATCLYEEDGEVKSVSLACEESDNTRATFTYPPAMVALPKGTEVAVKLVTHAGVEGGNVNSASKTVSTLAYASPDAYIWDIRTTGLAANTVKIDAEKEVTISGVQLSNAIDATLTLTCKDGTSGKVSIAKADFTKNTNTAVSFLFTEDKLPTALTGHSLAGATGKLLFRSEDGGVVEDYAFQYAE